MRISPIDEGDAEDSARELLRKYEAEHDKRPALWEVLANHPPLLEAHAHFYENTILSGNLDQELKELLGVVVSATNECDFCTSSHRVNLVDLFGYEGERVDRIECGDYDGLTERERTALAFAKQVAANPQAVTDDDFAALSAAGFSQQDVVELVGAIAQFVAANVYADTFAIDPAVYD